MANFLTQYGEAFSGHGPEAAHLNTIVGARGGPIETAWATALASPSHGHAPFVVCIQPNLAVKPPTLFVNKAGLHEGHHSTLTWGAAQAGVASGVLWAVHDGIIDRALVDELVVITAVWVDPEARKAELVFEFNREATVGALTNGRDGGADLEALIAARDKPINGYYLAERHRHVDTP